MEEAGGGGAVAEATRGTCMYASGFFGEGCRFGSSAPWPGPAAVEAFGPGGHQHPDLALTLALPPPSPPPPSPTSPLLVPPVPQSEAGGGGSHQHPDLAIFIRHLWICSDTYPPPPPPTRSPLLAPTVPSGESGGGGHQHPDLAIFIRHLWTCLPPADLHTAVYPALSSWSTPDTQVCVCVCGGGGAGAGIPLPAGVPSSGDLHTAEYPGMPPPASPPPPHTHTWASGPCLEAAALTYNS